MTDASLLHRIAVRAQLLVHRAGYDVFRESFKRQFVRSMTLHDIDAVLDVGANIGQFGRALRTAGFEGRIVSVEPVRSAFDALTGEAAADPGWSVVRAAVGEAPGELEINVAGNSVSSSVLPILERHTTAAPSSAYVRSEVVPATTVDVLMAEHGLDPARTLVKIDVQGYEMPVLLGARETLPVIAGVRTEMSLVALYAGQVLFPELLAHLGDRGLELWLVERGFVEPGTGRMLQVDGVFYRRDPDVAGKDPA